MLNKRTILEKQKEAEIRFNNISLAKSHLNGMKATLDLAISRRSKKVIQNAIDEKADNLNKIFKKR